MLLAFSVFKKQNISAVSQYDLPFLSNRFPAGIRVQ